MSCASTRVTLANQVLRPHSSRCKWPRIWWGLTEGRISLQDHTRSISLAQCLGTEHISLLSFLCIWPRGFQRLLVNRQRPRETQTACELVHTLSWKQYSILRMYLRHGPLPPRNLMLSLQKMPEDEETTLQLEQRPYRQMGLDRTHKTSKRRNNKVKPFLCQENHAMVWSWDIPQRLVG